MFDQAGLQINRSKTQIWVPDGSAPTTGHLHDLWQQASTTEGVVVCGTAHGMMDREDRLVEHLSPVGQPTFVQ
eukprot:10195261-Prorocentrum_lima.AAC.1